MLVGLQVDGKLLVGIAGGSPTKPTEISLLETKDANTLLSSKPSDWTALRKSSNVEVTTCPGVLGCEI